MSAREYLKTRDLVEMGPWSARELDRKIRRGELKEGVHFFVDGPRRQRIFKRSEIVKLVEQVGQPHQRQIVQVDVEQATADIQRLLGRAA